MLILEHEETKILAGGAANTIANLVDMGVKAYAVGVVGNDATGKDCAASWRTRVSVPKA